MLAGVDEIFVLQAEVLKVLASPRRLEILHLLAEGPVEVSRLAQSMGVSQPNVSQHLAVMRAAGVVEFERDGREVRYRLTDPQIIEACDTMRCVLQRRFARMADLSALALERPGSSSSELAAQARSASSGSGGSAASFSRSR